MSQDMKVRQENYRDLLTKNGHTYGMWEDSDRTPWA
jgi:hypothetical protein